MAKINNSYWGQLWLRHGFAVAALEHGIPLNMLQKWLGHPRLSTTAIYGSAIGAEERKLAEKLWN